MMTRLHRLEHVDTLLCVALTNLLQRFVFVTALTDILSVQDVIARHMRIHLRYRKIRTERLKHMNT